MKRGVSSLELSDGPNHGQRLIRFVLRDTKMLQCLSSTYLHQGASLDCSSPVSTGEKPSALSQKQRGTPTFGPEYHSVCRSSAATCLSQPYSFTCHGATPQSWTPYRSARDLSCRSFVFQQPRKPHDMIDVELAIQAKQAPVYVVLNSPFLPRDTHKSSA